MTWDNEDSRKDESIFVDNEPNSESSNNVAAIGVVIVTLIVLIARSQTLRFHLKYNAFTGIYFIFGIICIPIMLFNAGDPKSTRIPRLLVRRVQSPLFGVTCKVRGMEHYPKGSFVLVCNHQSSLDCIGVMELWPERCVIIMKKALKYAGPFGLGAILAGTIFVERSNNRSAKEMLKQAVETIQKRRYRILIFPEGTRSLPRESTKEALSEPMLPFKKGAFNLAVLAQVPIVPVVFSSQKHIVDFVAHKFVSGEYNATILPPISTEGLSLDDVPSLSDKVRNLMIDCFLNNKEPSEICSLKNGLSADMNSNCN